MKRVNYHLPDKTIASLKSLSNLTGIAMAEIIRRAIDSYLTQIDIPIFESMKNGQSSKRRRIHSNTK